MVLTENSKKQYGRRYKIRCMGSYKWKIIRDGVESDTYYGVSFRSVYKYIVLTIYQRYKVSVIWTKSSPESKYVPWFTVVDRNVRFNVEVVFVTRHFESLENFYKNKFLILLDKIF